MRWMGEGGAYWLNPSTLSQPGKAWEPGQTRAPRPSFSLPPSSFPPAVLCEIRNPTVDGALKGIPDFAANPWLEKKVFVLLSPGAVELSLVVTGPDNGSLSGFHPGWRWGGEEALFM